MTKYIDPTATARAAIRSLIVAATLPLALSACESQEPPAAEEVPVSDAAGAPASAGPVRPPATASQPVGAAPVSYRFGSGAAESQRCLQDRQQGIASAAAAQQADSTPDRPGAGRDPVFAEREGWYPQMPEFRNGAILPCSRIVAYYGHPSSTRMGALGEYPKDEMIRRWKAQVAE